MNYLFHLSALIIYFDESVNVKNRIEEVYNTNNLVKLNSFSKDFTSSH